MNKLMLTLTTAAFFQVPFALAQTAAAPAKIGNGVGQIQSGALSDAVQRRRSATDLFSSGQFERAALQWKSLVDSGAKSSADVYWLGESYYHLHRYADAARCFEQALLLDPKMDTARVRVVQAYLADKNRSQAQAACQAALPVVADPYAHQQLVTLSKITAFSGPLLPKAKLTGGEIEVPGK